MGIYTVPNQNAIQKQLDATLSSGATTMTLNESIEALLPNISANSPVSIVIDRIDANGVVITNGTREFITATGVSGAVLSGLTRNADGSSTDQEHAIGAIVEFIPDVLFAESIRATFDVEHNANGTHDDTVVTTLTGTQTLTNKTLTSPVLTTPKITTSINDTNGNEIIKTPATASAVNEITVTNSATGNAPSISATGGDTNIDLNLIPKGSGKVKVNSAYTLPSADGTASQVLQTNGSGVVSFGTVTSTTPLYKTYAADSTLSAALSAYKDVGSISISSGENPSGMIVQIFFSSCLYKTTTGGRSIIGIRVDGTADTAYIADSEFHSGFGTGGLTSDNSPSVFGSFITTLTSGAHTIYMVILSADAGTTNSRIQRMSLVQIV